MAIKAINPVNGKIFATYDDMTPSVVSGIIRDVHEAFLKWRHTSFEERAAMMREAARILRGKTGEYARLMAQEMGKPVRDGVAEVEKCASGCDFYAENAARFLAREPIATEARNSFVTFNPLGVVLAVMPWNFPFSQVPSVIEHPLVRAVTLTGSGPAGRAVAGKAGQMLKKTVLELGGSDPYLVLEDADLEMAAMVSTKGRLINAGQSCIAAKRFIVAEKVRRPFEELFVQKMGAVKTGDPLKEDTQIGPLARHDLRDELHRQVEASIAAGARCLLGGAIPNDPGAYYPPTVLTDVHRGMPAYEEELFGPVAAIISVKDEEEAIATANDSAFGLGGGVITRDLARGEHIAAERIESGCVFVNEAVRSDPRLPFGGVKESGFGRELSVYGIKEFVNIKTVYVA